MIKLSKGKYKMAEIYLKNYLIGQLHAQVENRKLEIMYPPKKSIPEGKKREELGVKVQTTRRNDQLERKVLRYVDDGSYVFLKNYLNIVGQYLCNLKSIDETTYDILVMFYRENKTWAEIADIVHLSISSCKRKRQHAIEELKERL